LPRQTNESAAERSDHASLAANVRHATEDPAVTSALNQRGQDGLRRKFEAQARELAGPDADEKDVARRAEHLWRAHLARLRLASAKARREARGAEQADAAAESQAAVS